MAALLSASPPALADVQVLYGTPPAAPTTPAPKRAAHKVAAKADNPPPHSPVADAVVRYALELQGRPYRFGGADPSGFDCSGFVQFVYAAYGIRLPRTADAQFASGAAIDSARPQPGDLVFFQTYEYGPSHVAIYIGNGSFVGSIGADVHVSNFASPYFASRYLGARHVIPSS